MEATSRRAWIKNAAIIFLVILLLLTFFSNTILNYSLPEVSAQYARYDSITGAIKASGSVKANESYSVVYDEADEDMTVANPGQTRKIVSVYVSQGSEVAIGDPILALEGGASKELEEAEKQLRELEKQYALDQLNDTISSLTSDKSKNESQTSLNKAYRELAELKELYAILAAGSDPTDALKEQKKTAQKEADGIQKQIDEINEKITETKSKISQAEGNIQEDYTSGKTLTQRYEEAKQAYEALQTQYDKLTAQVDTLQAQYDEAAGLSGDVGKAYEISQQIHTLNQTLNDLEKQLSRLIEDNTGDNTDSDISSDDISVLQSAYDKAREAFEDYKAEYGKQYEEQLRNYQKLEKEYADLEALCNLCIENPGYMDLNLESLLVDKQNAYDAYQAAPRDIIDIYAALETEYLKCEARLNSALAGNTNDMTSGTGSGSTNSYARQVEDLQEQIAETEYKISEAYAKLNILGLPYIDNLTDYYVDNTAEELNKALTDAKSDLTEVTADYEEAKAEYESLSKQISSTGVIADNEALLAVFEKDLENYKELLEEANEKVADIEEDIQDAADSRDPEEVKDQIDELTASISTMEMQMKIDEITGQKTDTEASYTREDQAKEIEALKADIEAMKNAPDETLVTAPIAGKIVEMNFVPGNSITSGTEVTRIEVADKGYICEISMSTEEARKIQVGAECSIVNSWWYSDIEATVSQIRSDPQSQGQNRIVVINVQGDVYEGQTLNFSIGDKSQSYDTVLPNSAIREDSEGKFVLVVESKDTPLSVRYTARRMNIEVIASDDTKSAVSGLYGSEFVITSSTSPISDGQQVRLAEN
ncbi:MAG: HlyD family efflux transporter periplasmic adaptor subunit [Clostridia bacterium]|nr:HlyD family efflux transporter periplasmic adaptor subunit [Clostridia bacterium]